MSVITCMCQIMCARAHFSGYGGTYTIKLVNETSGEEVKHTISVDEREENYYEIDFTPPVVTEISCIILESNVMLGEMVEVSGKIMPKVSGVKVTLTYTKPDDSTQSREVTTGSDGTYHDTYILDKSGSWRVNAAWEGDSTHHGAISEDTLFSVEEKTQEGIPGYPFESLILGMVMVLLVSWYGQSVVDGR